MAGKLNQTRIQRAISEVCDTGFSQRLTDSSNLILQIKPAHPARANTSWIFRYQIAGKRREMGLGSYPSLPPNRARIARDRLRMAVKGGYDPVNEQSQRKARRIAYVDQEQRQSMDFAGCCDAFITAKQQEWKSQKHRQQWENTLKTYAYPIFGHLSVDQIKTSHVLATVNPIWTSKTETAKRLLGRIERVMDYAISIGLRDSDNPARWQGHLVNTLPSPRKFQQVRHQRALPYSLAPSLARDLAEVDTPASRALLLTLFSACRTSEVIEATWDEIDFKNRLWTIPAERMKASKTHRIPLTQRAIDTLKRQQQNSPDHYIFRGQKTGSHLSNMAMASVLKRTNWHSKTSVHGLRSTFRCWVAEKTTYSDRLAEISLAHQLRDKVEAAYNRSDQLENRRELITDWCNFLTRPHLD